MKDYFGKGHYVENLGLVTFEEFKTKYNEMSCSPDKLPVASTILKFDDTRFNALIFYETAPGAGTEKQPAAKEENKPIKMVM